MEEFLKKYHTSKEGLNSSEVTKRQNQNGLNELKEKKKKSPVMLFLEQFIDVLIALLIVAAIAAYFVGDVIDSCVILIAVLLNTIIGFIQEYRSEKAIEMLKSVTTSHAVVRREGQVQKIDAKELTIGDIVILEEGDKNAEISAKNIPDVKTARVNTINVYDILKYNTVIATKAVVAAIEEVYAKWQIFSIMM